MSEGTLGIVSRSEPIALKAALPSFFGAAAVDAATEADDSAGFVSAMDALDVVNRVAKSTCK